MLSGVSWVNGGDAKFVGKAGSFPYGARDGRGDQIGEMHGRGMLLIFLLTNNYSPLTRRQSRCPKSFQAGISSGAECVSTQSNLFLPRGNFGSAARGVPDA